MGLDIEVFLGNDMLSEDFAFRASSLKPLFAQNMYIQFIAGSRTRKVVEINKIRVAEKVRDVLGHPETFFLSL